MEAARGGRVCVCVDGDCERPLVQQRGLTIPPPPLTLLTPPDFIDPDIDAKLAELEREEAEAEAAHQAEVSDGGCSCVCACGAPACVVQPCAIVLPTALCC